jgi:hypothetical protein
MSQPKRKLFGKLLISNILAFALFLYISYSILITLQKDGSTIKVIIQKWYLFVGLIILQILYLICAYKSSTKKILSSIMNSNEFMDHLIKMKKNTPHMELTRVLFYYRVSYLSWRYMTVAMQRTSAPNRMYGRKLKAIKMKELTQCFPYKFNEVHDNSLLNSDEVMKQSLVKIKFEKVINIGDESMNAIHTLMEEKSQEDLLSHQDAILSFDTIVPDFQKKILLVNPEKKWIYGNTAFFFATNLYCAWIYSIFIERSCVRKKFKVEKTVTYSR